ncbi:hypothetical protein BLSTO_06371 [Blastocystis sp. subtype 1]
MPSPLTRCAGTASARTLLRAYQRKHWNVDQIKQTAPQCKGYSFIEKWKNGVEKGCRVEGHLHVSKVQGHMFIIPSHANDLLTAGELRQVYPCRG